MNCIGLVLVFNVIGVVVIIDKELTVWSVEETMIRLMKLALYINCIQGVHNPVK